MGASSPASSLRPCTHNDDSNGLKTSRCVGSAGPGVVAGVPTGATIGPIVPGVMGFIGPIALGAGVGDTATGNLFDGTSQRRPRLRLLTRTKTNRLVTAARNAVLRLEPCPSPATPVAGAEAHRNHSTSAPFWPKQRNQGAKYAHLWICYCRCSGPVCLASKCTALRNWARRRGH